jgi:hypothetical protein
MGRFHEWIDKYGRANLARTLNVSGATITYWLTGATSPKSATMVKLVELSKGKITLHDILLDTGKIPPRKAKGK